jgi:hypothetical protein
MAPFNIDFCLGRVGWLETVILTVCKFFKNNRTVPCGTVLVGPRAV